MNQIRPLAICVFRNNDRILVFEGYDPIKQETFYRPLGGGIEFGEKAENTVRRELMEEINVEVGEVRYLGTLENIFTFNGTPGHEIVLIFDGALEMSGLYEQAVIVGEEAHGAVIRAVWKSLDEFGEGKSILYPDGLLNFLLDSLKEFMRERQVLLPRQFEQIMCAAPPPSELLSACAKLRMLVTSREALRLRGEREFPLSPLALPDQPSVEVLLQSPSVVLFVQRAQASLSDYKLTGENAVALL